MAWSGRRCYIFLTARVFVNFVMCLIRPRMKKTLTQLSPFPLQWRARFPPLPIAIWAACIFNSPPTRLTLRGRKLRTGIELRNKLPPLCRARGEAEMVTGAGATGPEGIIAAWEGNGGA
jgi:hypothetical protein